MLAQIQIKCAAVNNEDKQNKTGNERPYGADDIILTVAALGRFEHLFLGIAVFNAFAFRSAPTSQLYRDNTSQTRHESSAKERQS